MPDTPAPLRRKWGNVLDNAIANDNRSSLLLDIRVAERGWFCEIERVAVILMLRKIARKYDPSLDFEELLEAVIGEENELSRDQWHAYKYVLGREFNRRQQTAYAAKKGRNT